MEVWSADRAPEARGRQSRRILQEHDRDFHIPEATGALVRSGLGAFVHIGVDNVSTIPTTSYVAFVRDCEGTLLSVRLFPRDRRWSRVRT